MENESYVTKLLPYMALLHNKEWVWSNNHTAYCSHIHSLWIHSFSSSYRASRVSELWVLEVVDSIKLHSIQSEWEKHSIALLLEKHVCFGFKL